MAQATNTQNNNEKGSGSVENDVEQLKQDVRKLADSLQQLGRSKAAQGQEEFAARYDEAKRRAAELRAQAEDLADESVTRARVTVAERPFVSMAAALGLGVLLGALLRRN